MPRKPLLDRIVVQFAAAHARRAFRRFVSAAHAARSTQERVLREHLSRHSPSDFGRRHGFDRIRSYADFAARVPVAGYAAFAPYIERLRNGDLGALLGPRQRLHMFALTSGTTAEPKYIPVTDEFLRGYQSGWNAWGVKALLDHPGSFLRCIVQISSPMRERESPAGVPCGAITGLLAACQKRLVRKYYTAPLTIADIKDATAKYYAIMRLAIPRDVALLVTANPATLLKLARTADEHKHAIIRDIRDGTLTEDMPIDNAIRRALAPRLHKDPATARRLEQLAQRHGALRPRDYWNLSFLAHWTGGTMGLYRRFFPEWFGEAPVRDVGLLASEGRMSVPIADDTASGVLDMTTQFCEFVPADEHQPADVAAPRTVLRCHELRVGEEYFILLTNAAGLCRYDIGDRVRVTGFFGEAPLIEFLCKGAHTSSLAGEKLTEAQVVLAMQWLPLAVQSALSTGVLAPQFAERPYYRLYLDADSVPASFDVDTLAGDFDRALCELNVEYASKRQTDRLGPVQLALLAGGFLSERDAQLRTGGTSRAEQFKHQYLLPRPGLDAAWPMADRDRSVAS